MNGCGNALVLLTFHFNLNVYFDLFGNSPRQYFYRVCSVFPLAKFFERYENKIYQSVGLILLILGLLPNTILN